MEPSVIMSSNPLDESPDDDNDGSSTLSFWRLLFTVIAVIVALLFCCCNKRGKTRQPLSPKGATEKDEHSNEKTQTGNTGGMTNIDKGEADAVAIGSGVAGLCVAVLGFYIFYKTFPQDRTGSGSSKEAEFNGAKVVANDSSSAADEITNGDMEIVSSRHRTTIEIKNYKTAILKPKGNQSPQSSAYHWEGDELVPGYLIYQETNLLDGADSYPASRQRTATDELSEYSVVEVVVGNQTTDSYSIDTESMKEESRDTISDVTITKDAVSIGQQSKGSLPSRSSVLDVMGAETVDEAVEKLESLEKVTEIMQLAGLESTYLIFGIDYTASNTHQGRISFNGEPLHSIRADRMNPYQQVIAVMGKTLAPLASTGYIPAYGFGDIRTSDTSIFPLKEDGSCRSFDEVLEVYNSITPKIILSGPTNFAPLIYEAIEVCKKFRKFHVLVIVADGQVTNEAETRNAIVQACSYPLSIIVVGVGDGPWDMMRVFDDKLPKRTWDNFHFVEFHKITHAAKQPELSFAVQALLEIPDQYKAVKALGLLD